MMQPCACGSTEIFAIKPGAPPVYAPPLDLHGWPDLAARPTLIVAEVRDIFRCRACMTRTVQQPGKHSMTDRLVIEITGDLPDAGRFAILAAAEDAAKAMAAKGSAEHEIDLSVSVRSVRPIKKTAVAATGLAKAAE